MKRYEIHFISSYFYRFLDQARNCKWEASMEKNPTKRSIQSKALCQQQHQALHQRVVCQCPWWICHVIDGKPLIQTEAELDLPGQWKRSIGAWPTFAPGVDMVAFWKSWRQIMNVRAFCWVILCNWLLLCLNDFLCKVYIHIRSY